jgi:protein-S-isoprenylcysteine O-methyltransferase Ste14
MVTTTTVIGFLVIPWIIFFVYWTSAIIYEAVTRRGKKAEKSEPLAVLLLGRLFFYISIILVLTNSARGLQGYYPLGLNLLPNSFIIACIGFAVTLSGILFAIWARIALGSNWSADAVLKEGQTLVRNGPYGIVRHPIYAGITLGMLGSAMAENNIIGLIAVFFVLLFSYSRITYEEKFMKEKFGKEWEDYAKTVKEFVPWLW